MTVRPTESIIHRRLFGLHTSGACVAEARLQGRVGEINAFCETVSCPRHQPTPSSGLKAARRPQLCDWVTRVHDQAGVNLLRDEGERNCVMPFFDQSNHEIYEKQKHHVMLLIQKSYVFSLHLQILYQLFLI